VDQPLRGEVRQRAKPLILAPAALLFNIALELAFHRQLLTSLSKFAMYPLLAQDASQKMDSASAQLGDGEKRCGD
jgi:hypothetical protein